MDYSYKEGQRLVIELSYGVIYEATYDGGTKDRLDVVDIVEYPKENKVPGRLSFYRTEITSIIELDETQNVKEDSSYSDNNTSDDKSNQCTILLKKAEFNRLKDMSLNYIYMATMDKRYVEAVNYLINCESVGVVGLGSEFGRTKPIDILVLSSWDQVYIFDLFLFQNKSFPVELKNILETGSIKKIIHDSRALVDCLFHCHNAKVNNIFDTQVAAVMLSSKHNESSEKSLCTISDCLKHYFNFPRTFLTEGKNITSKEWKVRPLHERSKIKAAQLGTYLVTLKNTFERAMLQNFYDAVDYYSNSLKNSNSSFAIANLSRNNIPPQIVALAEKL